MHCYLLNIVCLEEVVLDLVSCQHRWDFSGQTLNKDLFFFKSTAIFKNSEAENVIILKPVETIFESQYKMLQTVGYLTPPSRG